jgi:transcriptional regulator with XRE-family HTH domain
MARDVFWERVITLIKEKKTTQKKAAAACGVNLRTFQNWIYKNLFPTVNEGYYLARFLGVSVEYLVTGREGESGRKAERARALLVKLDETLKTIV